MSACNGFDFRKIDTISDVFYNTEIIFTTPYRLLSEKIPDAMKPLQHFFEFDCSSSTAVGWFSLIFYILCFLWIKDFSKR